MKQSTESKPKDSVENKKTAEDLHPSWSARKKTTNIADFKGKKITFGGDSDSD